MSSSVSILRIGTRGSPLALAQAHEVAERLVALNPAITPEIVEITTTGDAILDRALSEIGGKGLFTKELDEAMIAGRIDIAVHSCKDLETQLAAPFTLGALLIREDVRDAFIARDAASIETLPIGAIVGTASLRRKAQVLAKRPDLKVVTFRGNVQTRLRKLREGVVDATLLAMAGLNRLGMASVATQALPTHDFVPAVAQGAIAITLLADAPAALRQIIDQLNDHPTWVAVTAERAFLAALDGSCRTPIAGHAHVSGSQAEGWRIKLDGLLADDEGTQMTRRQQSISLPANSSSDQQQQQLQQLGQQLAGEIRQAFAQETQLRKQAAEGAPPRP